MVGVIYLCGNGQTETLDYAWPGSNFAAGDIGGRVAHQFHLRSSRWAA